MGDAKAACCAVWLCGCAGVVDPGPLPTPTGGGTEATAGGSEATAGGSEATGGGSEATGGGSEATGGGMGGMGGSSVVDAGAPPIACDEGFIPTVQPGAHVITVDAASGPYRTLQAGVNAATAQLASGPVDVQVAAGTYTGTVSLSASGRPTARLTLRAAPGARVVLDARGSGTALSITGSYITVEGLEISGANGKGVDVDGNWVVLRRLVIHGIGGDCVSWNKAGAHHELLEASALYDCGEDGLFPDGTSQCVVRNNLFYGRSSLVLADPGGFRDSLIENNYFRSDQAPLGSLKLRHGNDGNDDAATRVRRNLFLEGGKYNLLLASSNGALVYHNTFFNSSAARVHERGLLYLQYDMSTVNRGNAVLNNVFQQTRDRVIDMQGSMFPDRKLQVIDQNLYFKTSGDDYFVFPDAQGAEQTHRTLAAWRTASGYDGHSVIADPRLEAPGLGVSPEAFAPAAGSPALDSAGPLTTVRSSGSGTSLPVLDARFFTDGFGLVAPDRVRVGGRPAVPVVAVDLGTHTLTLGSAISFAAGEALTLDYAGALPDLGAIERGVPSCVGRAAGRAAAFSEYP